MKVFCIIVTYYGFNHIKCNIKDILSCFAQNQLIVIDNGSKDGVGEFLQDNYPNVHFVQLDKNHGFGKANNLGISLAYEYGFDAVFLLNQDAYLKKKSFEKLIDCSQNHDGFGILSPIHLNGDGTLVDKNFFGYITNKNSLESRRFFSEIYLYGDNSKECYQIDFVNAAGWFVTKECIDKIGGFNPLFFHYGEDVNFAQRLKSFGFKIGFVPEAVLYHDREEREPEFGSGSKDILELVEDEFRKILIKILDVNHSTFPSRIINNIIWMNRKILLKAFLKFDFQEMKYRNLLIKRLRSNFRFMEESFYLDKNGGCNYLKISS